MDGIVIDNILTEWSYKCPDGIVDLNDPIKISVLKEILYEIESKQDLIDLIGNTDLNREQIKKIEKFISPKKTKKLGVHDELQNKFENKGLKRIAPIIIYLADKLDEEDKLLEYLNLTEGQITFENLKENNNLLSLFKNTGLSEEFITNLIKITANQIGAGELALVTFIGEAKKIPGKSGQGDIEIGNEILELKGNGAAISEWGSKVPIKEAFKKIYKIEDENELNKIASTNSWLIKLEKDLQGENKEKAKTVIKELYPTFDIDLNNLRKSIAQNYADQYFKNSKITSMLIIDEKTGNYKEYNKEDFKKELGNSISLSFTKDIAPRLYLQSKIDEETKE
jgi:hypothetical protein